MLQLRSVRCATALLLLAAVCSPAAADETLKPRGEKITLQLNLKKGDKKTLAHKMDMTTSVNVGGQGFDAAVKMGMYLSTTVDDVDAEKLHTLKLAYDRITMDMTSPAFSMSYDSKEPDKAGANPAFQMFNAMVGESITLQVTPKGETKDVKGIDELAKKLQEKAPPGVNVKQQLEGMKNAFEQFTAYPDKPVDIGDTWTRKTKIAADPNMPMEMDATYTLVDRKDGKAVIKMDGKMAVANGMKGTSTGKFSMDEATGWVTGGEMTMNMAGESNGAAISVKGKTTISDK